MLSLAKFARRPPIWGDGFIDDDVRNVVCPVDWDFVSPDELFRYYPSARSSVGWPMPVATAFIDCLRFADARASSIPPRIDKGVDLPERPICLIKSLISLPATDMPPIYDEVDAGLLAFVSGVHPAYVWQEALIAHDRFATYGWLGQALRHRRAFVPLEVAHYLRDVLPLARHDGSCSDAMLTQLLPSHAARVALRRAADQCIQRGAAIFRADLRSSR